MFNKKIISFCAWAVLVLSLVLAYGKYVENKQKSVAVQNIDIKNQSEADLLGETISTSTNDTELKLDPKNLQTEKTLKTFSVVRVIDGDTIVVDIYGVKEKVRLIGIDTPETVDPRKVIQCFGIEASENTKNLLTGQKVSLVADKTQEDRDKYGRLLRYVYLSNGLFVNKTILEQGYAYEYTYRVPYIFQKDFKQAQENARQNKNGLWATGICGANTIK